MQVLREYVQVCGNRCKDWFCPHCCKVQGGRFRARVIDAWAELKRPMMVTLTLDRRLFPGGPEAAYRHVQAERAVARLLGALKKWHSGKWFYVVEFQKDGGWPHWHVVVDSAYLPIKAVEREWAKYAPVGGQMRLGTMGMCRFTRGAGFESARHALLYVTKYLVKAPEDVASWVLDYKGRLRRFSTSRGFWGDESEEPRNRERQAEKREERTHRERVAACRSSCRVGFVREEVDEETGELKRRVSHLGTLRVPMRLLRKAVESATEQGELVPTWWRGSALRLGCGPGDWLAVVAGMWEGMTQGEVVRGGNLAWRLLRWWEVSDGGGGGFGEKKCSFEVAETMKSSMLVTSA